MTGIHLYNTHSDGDWDTNWKVKRWRMWDMKPPPTRWAHYRLRQCFFAPLILGWKKTSDPFIELVTTHLFLIGTGPDWHACARALGVGSCHFATGLWNATSPQLQPWERKRKGIIISHYKDPGPIKQPGFNGKQGTPGFFVAQLRAWINPCGFLSHHDLLLRSS